MGSNNLLESFKHAIDGIEEALRVERNLKIHFAIGFIVLIVAFFLNFAYTDMLWLIFAVFSVIGAELINTLVEGLMDVYSNEYNPMIKFVKDVSAGIVLWYTLFSVVIGVVIFGRELFGWKEDLGNILSIVFLVLFPFLVFWEAMRRNGRNKSN
ncbi:MAG: diacylglycerol kinase family protein [Thermotogaceae bacterium]|nr:diacylglycerol kinase family protein [Thermotogaceae bacterium]